jgi:ATP-dependent RNA helicase HelY
VSGKRSIRHAREDFLSGIGVPERTEFSPDPFQLEAIRSLCDGHDTLVIAPTGTGKTYIAVQAIEEMARQGKRSIYTAPLKALSNAKYAEFKKKFEPEISVGLLTGDRKIEGNATVVIATTEIYRNELYSYRENYGLVVLDELHYLADPQRGPVWEESIILAPRSATLLMLSASISNPDDIAAWIESIRHKPVNVITVKKRPVELRLGFMHPDYGVIPLEDDRGRLFEDVQQFYSSGGDHAPRGRGRDDRNRNRMRFRRRK